MKCNSKALPYLALAALALTQPATAACPSLEGAWNLNLVPTGRISIRDNLLFSGMRLVFQATGSTLDLTTGVGTQLSLDQRKPVVIQVLDDANGTVTLDAGCRLQLQLITTESRTYSDSTPNETNVPIAITASGKYLSQQKVFAGNGRIIEKGKVSKQAFTMTPFR